MNSKMLLAPFLAVVMALVIAGAVTMVLPLSPPDGSTEVYTTSGSLGLQPSAVPQAAPASAADLYTLPALIMIIVAAVIVGLAVVLLFFRKEPQ